MVPLTRISHVAVIVRDLETTFKWYSEVLGFEKRADVSLGSSERWLAIGLPDQPDFSIFLECPKVETHGSDLYALLSERIGKGSGLVLTTPDCREAHRKLVSCGVRFLSEPTKFPWGTTAMFQDLDGNALVLFEPGDAS